MKKVFSLSINSIIRKAVYLFLFLSAFSFAQSTYTVNYLIVAGGGGGAGYWGGGGGGGGVLTGTTSLPTGSYSVTVGSGGTGTQGSNANGLVGGNGGNSVFNSITAYGGGGGGGGSAYAIGANGGCGGGGGGSWVSSDGAGTGVSGQGYGGGIGENSSSNTGAGGGAGVAGGNATTSHGGNGGDGISSSITGTATYYGGGGGGATVTGSVAGLGGNGGGGNGASYPQNTDAVSGTNGLGGGGGGTYAPPTGAGGNGGSGIVILAFPTGSITYTTSGSVSTLGANTLITFNSSGTFGVFTPISISPSAPAICYGSSTSLTASGTPVSYTWSPSTGLSSTSGASVTATPSTTTIYTVSGTTSIGAVITQTVGVTVNPLPNLSINPYVPTVIDGIGAIIKARGAATYTWSPSTNLSSTTGATVTATPSVTTNYTLTGTSSAGCVSDISFYVSAEIWKQTADTANAPIYYGGKVGIGNTNPTTNLDVTGSTKISGTLMANAIGAVNSNLSMTSPTAFSSSVTIPTLTVTGTATISRLKIADTITVPTVIASRITSGDTNGVHIGDSSMVFNALPTSSPIWENMSSSLSNRSISIGTAAQAWGQNSIAIGATSVVKGQRSFALGYNVQTASTAYNAITLGSGIINISTGALGSPLVNNTANSLAVGFYSDSPTLFVSGGNGTSGSIGQVGIGTSAPVTGSILDINTNNYQTFFMTNAGAGSYNNIVQANDNALIWDDNTGGYPNAKGFVIAPWDNTATAGIRIDGAYGAVTIPGLVNASAGAGTTPYHTLLVDANGMLVSSGQVSGGTTGTAWVFGGNTVGNSTPATQTFGTTDYNDIAIQSAGVEIMHINAAANSPQGINSIALNNNLLLLRTNGDQNHGLGYFNNYINTASTFINGPVLFGYNGGALATTYGGNNIALRWDANGNVHIGQQSVINGPHTDALLTVSGKIACQEVRVFTNSAGTFWADYVFNNDYKLLPLQKVEDYYKKNKHLPGVPSTEEIKEQGNDLAKTDAILLSKIEENIIYIVDLNKKLEKLAQENEELKALVKKLLSK